jgi:hypothetical protein
LFFRASACASVTERIVGVPGAACGADACGDIWGAMDPPDWSAIEGTGADGRLEVLVSAIPWPKLQTDKSRKNKLILSLFILRQFPLDYPSIS